MPDDEVDTSRKTVKTFVPAYQKDRWKRHADELDMSQSEFVRTMVQAGRRDFDLGTHPLHSGSDSDTGSGDTPGSDVGGRGGEVESGRGDVEGGSGSDGGSGMEDRVVSILASSEHLSWDELVDRLTSDVEDRLDQALQRLQTENRIQYSGRHGGYALVEGEHGD